MRFEFKMYMGQLTNISQGPRIWAPFQYLDHIFRYGVSIKNMFIRQSYLGIETAPAASQSTMVTQDMYYIQ